MATYQQIEQWVKGRYGFAPKGCWIAHCKELNGIAVRRSHRRTGERKVPCPRDKRPAIEAAFRSFGML